MKNSAILWAVTTACLSVAVPVNAQTQQTRPAVAFEVASVRPSRLATDPTAPSRRRGGPGTSDPSRWVAENASLASLISFAYHLRRYEYSGADWLERAKFDISANVPSDATREMLPAMVGALLADRFHLRFHYEAKEAEGYALTVARTGPRLTPAVEEEPLPAGASTGPTRVDADGYPELPPGRSSAELILPNGRSSARVHKCTMSQFATFLSGEVHGRPVEDATGIQGEYDITLRWSVASIRAAPLPGDDALTGADVDSGPTVFEAVQKQLGLKLEPRKVQIRVLVVDYADKTPSEN